MFVRGLRRNDRGRLRIDGYSPVFVLAAVALVCYICSQGPRTSGRDRLRSGGDTSAAALEGAALVCRTCPPELPPTPGYYTHPPLDTTHTHHTGYYTHTLLDTTICNEEQTTQRQKPCRGAAAIAGAAINKKKSPREGQGGTRA